MISFDLLELANCKIVVDSELPTTAAGANKEDGVCYRDYVGIIVNG